MSEIVERVARALAPVAWAALGTGDTLANQSRRTASLRHARAAIAAMREPDSRMIEAGWINARDVDGNPSDDNAVACWEAMIDAALAQSE